MRMDHFMKATHSWGEWIHYVRNVDFFLPVAVEKLSRVVTLPPVGKGAGEPQATLLNGHQLPQVGSDEASSTAAFKSVMQSHLPAIYQTMHIFTHQKY